MNKGCHYLRITIISSEVWEFRQGGFNASHFFFLNRRPQRSRRNGCGVGHLNIQHSTRNFQFSITAIFLSVSLRPQAQRVFKIFSVLKRAQSEQGVIYNPITFILPGYSTVNLKGMVIFSPGSTVRIHSI